MADITMCTNEACKKKEICYRYMATPSQWQSYFAMGPVGDDGECEYYIEYRRAATKVQKKDKETSKSSADVEVTLK